MGFEKYDKKIPFAEVDRILSEMAGTLTAEQRGVVKGMLFKYKDKGVTKHDLEKIVGQMAEHSGDGIGHSEAHSIKHHFMKYFG